MVLVQFLKMKVVVFVVAVIVYITKKNTCVKPQDKAGQSCISLTNTKTNCDSDAQGEWGNFQGSRWRPKIQPWISSISFFFFLLFFPSQLVVWPHQHCKSLNRFSLGGRFHTLLIGSKEKDFFLTILYICSCKHFDLLLTMLC